MRDLTAHLFLLFLGLGFVTVLAVILTAVLATAPRRPGRHSAAHLAEQTAPAPAPVSPWSRPWTGPTKEEAAEIFRQEAKRSRVIRERRTAAALATLGVDYAYGYAGDHFETLSTLAAAGVTA
ncbi:MULTISPECIES: hypothetical protein [unclassified Streptomyces]|uniref:hypothetical protein n=1 Tax=unclassified Streptomyces TaxID=2593676 RepID=UPI0038249BDE